MPEISYSTPACDWKIYIKDKPNLYISSSLHKTNAVLDEMKLIFEQNMKCDVGIGVSLCIDENTKQKINTIWDRRIEDVI